MRGRLQHIQPPFEMKRLLISVMLMLACTFVWAQHQIILKNGLTIEGITLHEIKTHTVVYEKDQSLHDLKKEVIYQIITEEKIIAFEKDGTPIYVNVQQIEEEPEPEVKSLQKGDLITIYPTRGRAIKQVELFALKTHTLTYIKYGNLHDLFKNKIDRIETDSLILRFKTDGSDRYELKFEPKEKKEVKKVPVPEPEPQPEPEPEPEIVPEEIDSQPEEITPPEEEVIPVLPIPESVPEDTSVEIIGFDLDPESMSYQRAWFVTPTALVGTMGTLLGGMEFRRNHRESFVQEIGYVYNSLIAFDRTSFGFASHSAYRAYRKRDPVYKFRDSRSMSKRKYTEVEFVYKFGAFSSSSIYRNTEIGLNVSLGSQRVWNNGFMWESCWGFGLHGFNESWKSHGGSRSADWFAFPTVVYALKFGQVK